jgi:hypothetical protein
MSKTKTVATTLRQRPPPRDQDVKPSPKVMAALLECQREIGRDVKRQRIHFLYLKPRFLMAKDEGLTQNQIGKIVGCSGGHVGLVLTWNPDKAVTPYAGHHTQRNARGGGQYLDVRSAVVGKIMSGRVQLELVELTAAIKLVKLDVTKLTYKQRADAVAALLGLVGRLNDAAPVALAA